MISVASWANRLAHFVVLCCRSLAAQGRLFSLENPATSLLWDLPEMVALAEDHLVVQLDQCQFGLRAPSDALQPGELIKKGTKILTNAPGLQLLSNKCDGKHTHCRCLGSTRVNGKSLSIAKFAGRYPLALCNAWATAVAQDLSR